MDFEIYEAFKDQRMIALESDRHLYKFLPDYSFVSSGKLYLVDNIELKAKN